MDFKLGVPGGLFAPLVFGGQARDAWPMERGRALRTLGRIGGCADKTRSRRRSLAGRRRAALRGRVRRHLKAALSGIIFRKKTAVKEAVRGNHSMKCTSGKAGAIWYNSRKEAYILKEAAQGETRR